MITYPFRAGEHERTVLRSGPKPLGVNRAAPAMSAWTGDSAARPKPSSAGMNTPEWIGTPAEMEKIRVSWLRDGMMEMVVDPAAATCPAPHPAQLLIEALGT